MDRVGRRYRIYCDESGHLLNDQLKVMVLGALWLPEDFAPHATARIREFTHKHGLAPNFEIKWTKVSESKIDFYLDLLEYFFDSSPLCFRAVVVPDKSLLDHQRFDQDHDTWYYKMYYTLLKNIVSTEAEYRIFIDVKDTRSSQKNRKLREVLAFSQYDFSQRSIRRLQAVRSEEVVLMQLADLLIGAVAAANRGTTTNQGKLRLIEYIRSQSGFSLKRSTLPSERKFNVFHWRADWGGSS